jgi:hypothetical protein
MSKEMHKDAPSVEQSYKIEKLQNEITELRTIISTMRDCLDGFLSLTRESDGVVGYYLYGDVANWSEFDFVANAVNILSNTSGSYCAKT